MEESFAQQQEGDELNPSKKDIQQFEDVLKQINGWGCYQKRQLIIFIGLTIIMAYVSYSPILMLYTPDHWCKPHSSFWNSSLNENEIIDATIPLDEQGNRQKCFMYKKVVFNSQNQLINRQNLSSVKCEFGWNYNETNYFQSVSSDMNWVCDDNWKPAFTQSMFYAGGVVGTLIFGYLADNLGRKFTFYLSNCLLVTMGFLTPFCNSFTLYSLIRFATGLANLTFFNVFFLLNLEYVQIEKRSLVGNLSLALGITIGGSIQPWILWLVGNWKIFNYILFSQAIFILFTPKFVHESVRWLASKGKIDEGLIILQKIAQTNGKQFTELNQQQFKKMVEFQMKCSNQQPKVNLFHIFKYPNLRKNICVMILVWMFIAGMFDGHIRNITNLNYSIYVTFTISSLLELPADLLAIWGLNYFGRKRSAFGSQILAGFCMLLCAYTIENVLATSILAMIGRFFMTYAMNTGAQISFEIVPTVLRGQGNALANVFAQVALFFSPFIVYSGEHSKVYPFVILAFGSILGGILSLFLPETAHKELPDTIVEGENFGKHQKWFHLPFLNK